MFKRFVWIFSWTVIFALVLLVMPVDRAQAYLDPGSGSLIIQVLIGGLLGLLVALKLYWGRIIGFITGKKPTDSADNVQISSDQTQPPADKLP